MEHRKVSIGLKVVIAIFLAFVTWAACSTYADAAGLPPEDEPVNTTISFSNWGEVESGYSLNGTCYQRGFAFTARDRGGHITLKAGWVPHFCVSGGLIRSRSQECWRISGTADYFGCSKGASGVPSNRVHLHTEWDYRVGVCPLCFHYRPHVEAWVYPSGLIKGTFYTA